jgi:hypothetical protein
MVFCLLLALTTIAGAEPRPWPVVLELVDPEGRLGASPVVTVTDADGQARDMLPRDDGEAPDDKPGDGVFTHPLPKLPDGGVTVLVRTTTGVWRGAATIADSAGGTLVVRVAADGTATVSLTTDSAVAGAFDLGAPSRTIAEFRGGFLLWAVLLAGVGVGVGSVLADGGRKSRVPARLAATDAGPHIAPVRLDLAGVAAALAGPLADHRVVCAGPHDSHPSVLACLEAGVLPTELVAAVEALAARPGLPVALLVTDLATLDAPGGRPTAEALNAAVGGRFPLYVVGGPAGWA